MNTRDSASGRLSLLFQWILFVMLLLLLGSFFAHRPEEVNEDLGRHIKTGEVIWQTKNVPSRNLFSFTLPEKHIVNHHWLSQLLFYFLYSAGGLTLFPIAAALIAMAAFAILYPKPRFGAHPFVSIGVLPLSGFLAIRVIAERALIRPELWSLFFFSLFIVIVTRSQKSDGASRLLWLIPILQIIWTNLHVYFFLGPALILFLWLDALVRKKRVMLKRVTIVGILSALSLLVNPQFLKGALYPLFALRDASVYSIAELKPFWFIEQFHHIDALPYFKILFALLWITIAIRFVFAREPRLNVCTLLTAALASFLAFFAIRNFLYFAPAAIAAIGETLASFRPRPEARAFFLRLTAKKPISLIWRKTPHTLIALSLGGILAIGLLSFQIADVVSNRYWIRSESSTRFGTGTPRMPQGAVNFLRQHNLEGAIWNNFDIGGFLIWQLWPQRGVFVDNRPDAYGDDFFREIYMPMLQDAAAWRALTQTYDIRVVIADHSDALPEFQTFLRRLIQDPNWALVYLDRQALLFAQRSDANKALVSQFLIEEQKVIDDMGLYFEDASSPEILNLVNVFQAFQWNRAADLYLEKLIKRDPAYARAYLVYGYFRARNNDGKGAIPLLLQAATLPSHTFSYVDYSTMWTVLGELYYETNQYEKASAAFKKAISYYGGNDIAALWLERMKRETLHLFPF